jgi:uncharacterized protein (TIGR02996 family)
VNDGAALLRAICAEPADDTARLVYADYLDEHGEAVRAAFIRAQVELAKLPEPELKTIGESPAGKQHGDRTGGRCQRCVRAAPNKCPYHELHDHAEDLLIGPNPNVYRNEVIWFNDGSGTDTWVILFRPQWWRGFVESVSADMRRYLDTPAIFATHPITAVRFGDRLPIPDPPAGRVTWFFTSSDLDLRFGQMLPSSFLRPMARHPLCRPGHPDIVHCPTRLEARLALSDVAVNLAREYHGLPPLPLTKPQRAGLT